MYICKNVNFFFVFILTIGFFSFPAKSEIFGEEPLIGSLKGLSVSSHHQRTDCLQITEKELESKILELLEEKGIDALDKRQFFNLSINKQINEKKYGKYAVVSSTTKLENNKCVAYVQADLRYWIEAYIPYTDNKRTRIYSPTFINSEVIVGTSEEVTSRFDAFNVTSVEILVDFISHYRKETFNNFPEIKAALNQ